MGLGIWILFGSTTSNPCNYKSIGDIPTPWGYERIPGDDPAYSEFLRKLPLKSKGSDVMLYTGGRSRFQSLNYAVVAVPLLSNAEQCADVCMRLRAEYLYHTGQVAETCVDRDLSSDSMVIGTSAIIDTEIDGAVGMNSGIFNNPFMIWGKYRKKLFRYYLPVSFQFHHTQMDGAHAGRFLENLQKEINNLRSI